MDVEVRVLFWAPPISKYLYLYRNFGWTLKRFVPNYPKNSYQIGEPTIAAPSWYDL
jgi:hypothetical protein